MLENMKAFAADIDMTLTSKGSALPERNKEALEILHRNGIKLGLATGRSMRDELKHQGRTWGLSFEFDYLVCLNGGQLYDAEEDRFWSVDMLTCEEMKMLLSRLMPLIDRYEIAVNAEGGDNHNAMNISEAIIESAKRHGFVLKDCTGNLDEFCSLPTYKMLLRFDGKNEQEVRSFFLKEFGEEYQIIGTYPGTLEVMRRGIDKGSGLARYAEWKGMSLNDFVAFGDNENDNTMLEAAGWSVCLKNGSDESKACADDVTELNCMEGGLGEYLFRNYILPNGLK